MTYHDDWFDSVPKVELNVHLGGSIPPATLEKLMRKYDGHAPTKEQLAEKFTYRDFLHFLEVWKWKDQFLRKYEDFEIISEDVARDMQGQNIKYVEMFFSPTTHRLHKGLDTQKLISAVRRGFDRVPEITINLIIDLARNLPLESELETVEAIADLKHLGVIGIGLGGPERDFPPGLFEMAFNRARDIGLHVTAHAGEAAGSQSIWEAINRLHVERIGHAAHAYEDMKHINHLTEHNIPVELCPI